VTSALILHNIRSVYNVGSIFRTADAAGVSKIILSGYTPAPIDRFNQPRKDFSKVSLGAEKAVAWESARTLASAVKKLKQEGFYFAFKAPEKIALVLGNEVCGLSAVSLKLCDAALEIPMHGMKESLNVSVAAGIAMFTILAK
jgi:tRNA G18 (ribose-2'-O)-methylase SpoU